MAIPTARLGVEHGANVDMNHTLTRPPRPRFGPYAGNGERCRRCPRLAEILQWCRQHAEDVADQRVSKFVRRRDGACVMCSERAPWLLEAAHILRRRYMRVRWNPVNLLALCSSCHYGFDHEPKTGRAWLRDNRPGLLEQLEELKESAPMPDVGEVIVRYAV